MQRWPWVGFSRRREEGSASLRRSSLTGGGEMEAPWRQGGRGRGRARPGEGLAARAGAAARPPAARARGGACATAAGSSSEAASGECLVLLLTPVRPGAAGRRAGEPAVASSAAGPRGAPANAQVGALSVVVWREGGRGTLVWLAGPARLLAARRQRAMVFAMCRHCLWAPPGETRGPGSGARGCVLPRCRVRALQAEEV